MSLVLGLERFCPWPREGLSSKSQSLASDFFCVLGIEGCVLDSATGYCMIFLLRLGLRLGLELGLSLWVEQPTAIFSLWIAQRRGIVEMT